MAVILETERDIVCALDTLPSLWLTQGKMCDNTQWVNQKVKEFPDRIDIFFKHVYCRMTESKIQVSLHKTPPTREIKVIIKDTGTADERKMESRETPHFTSSGPAKGVSSHHWLDSTSRFASEMLPFWQDTLKHFMDSRNNQSTLERIEDDVVAALIDDGIDMFDTALSNQVLEGKSFDFHDGKVRPSFSSARGRGTVMASLILRGCPMAKIYPVRLRTYETPDGKNQIDRRYAAQVRREQ